MTTTPFPSRVHTYSGKLVDGPIDINNYWGDRKNHDLYRMMLTMAAGLFRDARSAIDVGCYTSGLLVEMDWIAKRVATDIQAKLAENWKPVQSVDFISGDAFAIDFPEKFDLVISSQTVEHLDKPAEFVEKLLRLGRGLLISTTYETPQGLIPGHVQDPISLEKFQSWFPVPLDAWTICYHPSRKIGHIIGVLKNLQPGKTFPSTQPVKAVSAPPKARRSHPVPTKPDILERLRKFTPISAIVDVGVRECTGELIQAFRDKHHYLFEPMALYQPIIEKNYATLPHTLFPLALSAADASLFLIQSSLERDKKITHSQISPTPKECDGHTIISCDPFVVRRFDGLELAATIEKNFLLKVDVDGKDLEVLKGFGGRLQLASAVIIECTTETMSKRIGFLQEQGFSLIDMVDIVHYGPSLYQFDAVLVRKDLVTKELKPNIAEFQREFWHQAKFA